MPMAESQIKVSSIMFTDIVGYSRMVARDESHALKLLDEHNTLISKSIEEYNGHIIKLIGDSVFAEFPKSRDAANCSIDIQINLIKRNKIHSKNERIHIRIGLHMGDVVVKGDDLFGNTVNLGSRIEGVAPADGILISNPVFNAINRDTSFSIKELGFVKLKNMKEPCQLFKLYLNQLDYTAQTNDDLKRETKERGIHLVDMETYNPLDVYAIGVLYFKNLGDVKDEFVCRGITQDIVNDLTKINTFRIPSAIEIDQYKDTELPLSEVARRMQVEYMLMGSILKEGEEFILNLAMQDMNRGINHWEKTFKFKSTEINAAKGDILLKILSQFNLELPNHIAKYFQVEPTSNSEALHHYIRARHLMRFPKSHDHINEARDLLDDATVLDPAFLYAHANKGWSSFLLGNFDEAEEQFYSALNLADQDNLDSSNAYVYNYMGVLYNKLEKYNKSIHYLEDALDIYIKYDSRKAIAAVLHNLGTALNNSGKQEQALDCFNRSLIIKMEFEDQRVLASGYNQTANVYYTIGDYSLAIENAKRSLGYYKSLGNMQYGAVCMIVLADSFAQVGMFSESVKRLEPAQEILEEFNNLFLLGKVDVLYGIKYFNEGNYEKSVSYYEEGIDKMQLDESRKWVLHYSIEIIHVLLYQEEYEKALKYIKRCKLLLKKTTDTNKKDAKLLDSMELYIEFMEKNKEIEKLTQLFKGLQKSSDEHYLSWYYLAKAFSESEMTSQAEESMQYARDILNKEENKISEPSHRASFLNKRILHLAITA